MSDKGTYDAVIIGAGQAGVPLATDLAAAGWRVAVVERAHVGGTCVNEGCTPSKTLLASARMAYLARRARDYGVNTGSVSVDMPKVHRRMQDLVDSWREGSRRMLEKTENLDLFLGEASFLDSHTLSLQRAPGSREATALPERLAAEHIFINTGCRPAIPPVEGIDSAPYLDSTTIMALTDVPGHLLILGGGYVALEFAQMFRRFGSEITIVERRSVLMSREDTDVSEALAAILREDGVTLHLDAEAHSVGSVSGRVELGVRTSAGELTLTGTHLLVAAGRTPNTDTLNLQAAGLEPDDRGYIPVNDRLETAVEGIYALGDVNGGPAFTHVSYDDYRVIRDDLLGDGYGSTKDRLLCYAVYTDPELGRVGLTEREAREQGFDVKVVTLSMGDVPRAIETGETRGFMKAIVNTKDDHILGCAALGVHGAELVSMVELAMMGGLTATQMRDAIFIHPALAESINALFDQ